jgi:hypothetical protein
MADRAMRPFWIHQLAEYLIGLALIAQGMQDPDPVVPALAGVLVMVNVSIARGPLGAFKLVGRKVHKWMDLLVMVAIVVGAVQPSIQVNSSGRLIMLLMLIPLGFLWFYTDWEERGARKDRRLAGADGGRGEDVGRKAGRYAGNAYKAIKNRSK